MRSVTFWRVFSLAIAFILLASACGPSTVAGFTIPSSSKDKYNIAMVLSGTRDDLGWSQTHYNGLVYLQEHVQNVHVAYIEKVPGGAVSENVIRALARNGYNLILAASSGNAKSVYTDAMQKVAQEFPGTYFIDVGGDKSNSTNFGNLTGAMEDMEYLAGILAGARAKKDGKSQIGLIAIYPTPENIRLGNAFALGVKKACQDCVINVSFIATWHSEYIERNMASELFDAGAQVVNTLGDTTGVTGVAENKGKWGVTYIYPGACNSKTCLTTPYWNWGPVYAKIVEAARNQTYRAGWSYFDADSGGLGLYGFMEGQKLPPGAADLPADVIDLVRSSLAKMLKGEMNRFDVFKGPLTDNKGTVILPPGFKMNQLDLVQFPDDKLGCKTCMQWWADGIQGEIPKY